MGVTAARSLSSPCHDIHGVSTPEPQTRQPVGTLHTYSDCCYPSNP